MLKQNMGRLDRILRLASGTVLLSVGAFALNGLGGGGLGLVLAALGSLGVTTGAVGFCPLYVPLGLSTAQHGERPDHVDGTEYPRVQATRRFTK